MPEELKKNMNRFKVINTSAAAQKNLQLKKAQLEVFKSIVAKSKLSEEEAEKLALELGRKVNAGMHKRYKEKYGI